MKTRALAALGVLISAGVHLTMWFNGVRDQHVVGPAFLVNAAGGVAIAVLLVTWRHWLPLLLAAGFGASTLGAFVVAATVGLFGVHDHWTGGYVWTAAVSEIVALLAAVLAGLQEGWWSRASMSHQHHHAGGRRLAHLAHHQ